MEITKKIAFALCIIILGIGSIYYIYSKQLNYPVIRSDGEGYYAYLPALFIYHDISLFTLVHGPLQHHAPQSVQLMEGTGKYLIRYPCSVFLT